jgi:nucleoid DNA-binding protein
MTKKDFAKRIAQELGVSLKAAEHYVQVYQRVIQVHFRESDEPIRGFGEYRLVKDQDRISFSSSKGFIETHHSSESQEDTTTQDVKQDMIEETTMSQDVESVVENSDEPHYVCE